MDPNIKAQNTLLWNQDPYLNDSGISTKAPSEKSYSSSVYHNLDSGNQSPQNRFIDNNCSGNYGHNERTVQHHRTNNCVPANRLRENVPTLYQTPGQPRSHPGSYYNEIHYEQRPTRNATVTHDREMKSPSTRHQGHFGNQSGNYYGYEERVPEQPMRGPDTSLNIANNVKSESVHQPGTSQIQNNYGMFACMEERGMSGVLVPPCTTPTTPYACDYDIKPSLVPENAREAPSESQGSMEYNYKTEDIMNMIVLLNDDDKVVVEETARLVQLLCKREIHRKQLLNAPQINEMVAMLLGTLSRVTHREVNTVKAVTDSLYQLTLEQEYPAGVVAILRNDGINVLLRTLSSNIESVITVCTLNNILKRREGIDVEAARTCVRNAHGTQLLMRILRNTLYHDPNTLTKKDNIRNVQMLSVLIDCLCGLARYHHPTKEIIMTCGGVQDLTRLLAIYSSDNDGSNDKMLCTAAELLIALSVCEKFKKSMIEAGVMQILTNHLGSCNVRLVEIVLTLLRNLSDMAIMMEGQENLLQWAVTLLSHNDKNISLCCVALLANLTCSNSKNKLFVCHVGGIKALAGIVSMAAMKLRMACADTKPWLEIIERAIRALVHLTVGHAEAERAQNVIRNYGSINEMAELLNPSASWSLIKVIVQLLRNVARYPVNCEILRQLTIVEKLLLILSQTYQHIQHNVTRPNMGAECKEMGNIIEAALSALIFLAADEQNRKIMRDRQMVPMLAEILRNDNFENFQSLAVRVLCEMCKDEETVYQVNRMDVIVAQLNTLSKLPDVTATFARAIELRIMECKKRMATNGGMAIKQESFDTSWSNMDDLTLSPDLQDMLLDSDSDLYKQSANTPHHRAGVEEFPIDFINDFGEGPAMSYEMDMEVGMDWNLIGYPD